MNVEIGAEAALFPEKEYINGIAFAVYFTLCIANIIFAPKWGIYLHLKTAVQST
jgi:hypothetical protein